MNRRVMLFLFLLMPVLVLAVPPEPNFHQFYGIVTGADEALSIKAQAGSKIFEAAIVAGEYGKDTPFLVEGKEGETIKFFIDDAQVETYTLTIGEVTQLDLELKGTEGTETDETVSDEAEEAVPAEEPTAVEEAAGGEAVLPEGEPGAGEAAAETFGGEAVPEGEPVLGAESGEEEVSFMEEQKKAGESNLFTYLIIVGTAFLLAVAILLLVFWRKGKTKLQAGTGIELFYGETCRHPSHQQYPAHKHERPAEVCQALEHKNYPPHRH